MSQIKMTGAKNENNTQKTCNMILISAQMWISGNDCCN